MRELLSSRSNLPPVPAFSFQLGVASRSFHRSRRRRFIKTGTRTALSARIRDFNDHAHKVIRDPFLHFHGATFGFTFGHGVGMPECVTTETFAREIAEATKAYDKYVICLDKTAEEFQAALISLLQKAIKAYEGRGPLLRHGIALDKHLTIILSQTEGARPLCGIYFNLHSPYQKQAAVKTAKALKEAVSGDQSL